MKINVIVPDQSVVIDDEGFICPDLVAPDPWAWAYHWDGDHGVIEPQSWLGRDPELFSDRDRIQFAIDAMARAKLNTLYS